MKRLFSVLFVTLFSITACDDSAADLQEGDYLIFGRFAGFCQGDCFSVFRVTQSDLTEDETAQRYNGTGYEYTADRTLSKAHFALAKDLLSNLPAELLTSDKEVYGCPDCADQGGILVSFSYNGTEKTFRLDTRQTEDQSEAILAFKTEINEVLSEIQ
jgi:hypothetical protein